MTDPEVAGALVDALGLDTVTQVLLYHVRAGGATVAELQDERLIDTALEGATLGVVGDELIDKDPQVENPNFIEGLTDIETANGEIQAIDLKHWKGSRRDLFFKDLFAAVAAKLEGRPVPAAKGPIPALLSPNPFYFS